MSEDLSTRLTKLLYAAGKGDPQADRRLWNVIYDELHRVAQDQLADDATRVALQPTVLVHEVYFRLFGDHQFQWVNRRQFFAAAAQAMRRIRIDDARNRKRLKRGGGQKIAPLTDDVPWFDQDLDEVLAVDEALTKLEQSAPRQAEVVKLRYFAGLTRDECAAALEVSPRTVDADTAFARAWLHRELAECDETTEGDRH